jgi:hypothetical protein
MQLTTILNIDIPIYIYDDQGFIMPSGVSFQLRTLLFIHKNVT